MIVRVRRFAVAESLPPSVEVEARPGATLTDLFNDLGSRYGPSIVAEIMDGGGLRAGIIVLVNGRSCEQTGGLSTRLSGGDEVFLSPAVHGG